MLGGAKALRTWMDAQIDNAELLDEPATKQAPNDDIRESISSNESSDATIQPQPSEANAKIEENISDADSFSASIPQDESAEDAALRQQMIRYNLEDVGAVVAEMDVDEDSDSWSNVDDEKDNLDGSNTEEDEDEDEDEDKFGRTRHRVVDDDYRRQMYDLENKLNINSMRNLGPNASISNVSEVRSPSTKTRDETNIRAQNPSPTKEVRFADKLDILPATTISDTQQPSENSINRANPNLAHSENAPPKTLPPISAASSPTSSILQPSRFKKALQNQFPQQQQNPPAKANAEASHPKPPSGVHSPIVIERPYHPLTLPFSSSSSSSSLNDHLQPPAEPDALDPLLLQQQVSAEYHRKRNRIIHRQGGFLASAEEEANEGRMPLAEEDGGQKKVSRFKAARLRKDGGWVR